MAAPSVGATAVGACRYASLDRRVQRLAAEAEAASAEGTFGVACDLLALSLDNIKAKLALINCTCLTVPPARRRASCSLSVTSRRGFGCDPLAMWSAR